MHRSRLLSAVLSAALGATLLAVAPGSPAEAASSPSLSWQHHPYSGHRLTSAPTIADVDGNGVNDVVVGGLDGKVYIYRADGSNLPGWPRKAVVKGSEGTAVRGSITVADLDKDGKNEVIVPTGSGGVKNQHGGLIVFRADGSIRWRYIPRDIFTAWNMKAEKDGYSEGIGSVPAVGDVDGDGYPDVVFGTWDHRIVALDRHGRYVSGFPIEHEDTISSSPALFDVDGDGRLEVFIGGDSMAGGAEDWDGGVLRALDWVNGRVIEKWKVREPEIFMSSPAIGDIDGDGRMELVIGSGNFYNNEASKQVYAYNLEDGSSLRNWPKKTGDWVTSSPALADLDGDGTLDVVISSKDGKVYAWKGSGKRLWSQVPSEGVGQTAGRSTSGPIVGDVDGDGRLEVVVMGASSGFILDARTGTPEQTFSEGWGYSNVSALGKFGTRGWMVVTAGYRVSNETTRIAAYEIANPRVKSPWPENRRNQRHTGAFPGKDSANWATGGYRMVTEKGAVFALGTANYKGGANNFPHTGIADVVAEPKGGGYMMIARNGGVFSFGMRFHGAATSIRTVGEFVAGMAHPSGKGYYLVTDRGAIYSYGKVPFYGAATNIRTVGKFVDAIMHPSGKGYYLVTDRGAIYTFGDVPFFGAATNIRTVGKFVSAMMHPSGKGYYLVTDRGAVYTFGKVPFHGAATDFVVAPITDAQYVPGKGGYRMVDTEGHVYAFGKAPFAGTVDHLNPDTIRAVF